MRINRPLGVGVQAQYRDTQATAPAAVLSSPPYKTWPLLIHFTIRISQRWIFYIVIIFQPSAYSTYFMSATHCADSLEFKIFIYLSFITQSNIIISTHAVLRHKEMFASKQCSLRWREILINTKSSGSFHGNIIENRGWQAPH